MRVEDRSTRIWWMAATLLVAGALLLRAETLALRPLWADERAVHAFAVSAERSGFAEAARPEAGRQTEAQLAPLHVALVVAATRVLGDSPAALRLPSTLASVATLLLLMALGRALFGRRTALAAGALYAISPYQIEYAQDARAYVLFVALTTAQLLAWFRYAATHQGVWLAVFTACGAASLYTHHLGLVSQAALAVIALATAAGDRLAGTPPSSHRRLGGRELLGIALAFNLIGILYLPQLPNALGFLRSGVADPLVLLTPSPRFLQELAARWGGGGGPVLWLYALCFGVGVLAGVRSGRASLALLWWIAAPIAVFSLIPFSKFFDARYLMTGQPAFLLLVAYGAVTLFDVARRALARRLPARARAAAALTAAALALAFAAPAARAYLEFRRLPLRCSEFFLEPRILDLADGFCRRHIVLNTLVPEQRWLLRPAAPALPRGVDVAGPDLQGR
jgi:4-amino-4-deoxy-L-arabinose transferase-like glycosyltransferase